jgi:predicted transcriptional regulator of viral defense system
MALESDLRKKSSFTTKEANSYGVSSRMLSYYEKTGKIERLSRGVYRFSQYIAKDENLPWEDLSVAAHRIPGAVICLISALNFYGLTDERMKENWIAVPHSHPHVHFPMTRIVRMRNTSLGVQKRKISEIEVKIFDPERTIIDSFRLLDFETAIKALKLYLQGKCGRPNIKKLNFYSKELRAGIDKYLAPLLI